MENDSQPLHDDPEIAALLAFAPVPRRNKRHDGWSDEIQRGYIIGLARTGNVDRAAQSVDRTQSGAWTVRNAAGAGEFSEAWDAAVALYHKRNPQRPPGPGRAAGRACSAEEEPDPEFDSAVAEADAQLEALDRIFDKYWRNLDRERSARLDGRIAEADFYVRQLTYIEIVLELGDKAHDVMLGLKRGGHTPLEIAATPVSLMLDYLRRAYWAEKGEPERPTLSALGLHTDEVAVGERDYYCADEHGPYDEWKRRREEKFALAAEAQRLWEEKARAEAEEWARREADKSDADETEARR